MAQELWIFLLLRVHCSSLGEDYARFGYDGPFLLGDAVLVHVDVIAVGIEAAVEDERRVHEAARINQTASLTNLHLLHIEDEAAIEDVESKCTFPSEEQDLVVGDLVGQAHVAGHPVRLVDLGSGNFLPNVA